MRPGGIVGTAVLSVAGLMGLGFVHPWGDPRVEPAKGLDTLLAGAEMPEPAKAVLVAKCADCHSSETHWPMYSRVAPGSWLMERDIVKGREHLDLSKWAELSPERQEQMEAKIFKETKDGEMPPIQYLAIHWGARLSKDDVQALALLNKDGTPVETAADGVGDATRGKEVFEKRCTGCHAMDAERDGPRLAGVFGRKAGAVPGFNYSAALKKAGITWDDKTLDTWLADTDAMVPDNDMGFRVPKAQERLDLIAYLKTTK
jgi:cytochrome c